MNKKIPNPEPGPKKRSAPVVPVMQSVRELTPKAEAKMANKLPRAEQMKKFKKSLEAHDSGNQPA
jgi:hypothetical protein